MTDKEITDALWNREEEGLAAVMALCGARCRRIAGNILPDADAEEVVAVTRDEKGLQYETEYLYTGRDKNIVPTYAALSEYSEGPVDYWTGKEHIVNPEAPRTIMNGENGTLVYFNGDETNPVMEAGEEVTVYLQNMMFTYGQSYHTEGAEPLATVQIP